MLMTIGTSFDMDNDLSIVVDVQMTMIMMWMILRFDTFIQHRKVKRYVSTMLYRRKVKEFT